jgi:hypothetical protein
MTIRRPRGRVYTSNAARWGSSFAAVTSRRCVTPAGEKAKREARHPLLEHEEGEAVVAALSVAAGLELR